MTAYIASTRPVGRQADFYTFSGLFAHKFDKAEKDDVAMPINKPGHVAAPQRSHAGSDAGCLMSGVWPKTTMVRLDVDTETSTLDCHR